MTRLAALVAALAIASDVSGSALAAGRGHTIGMLAGEPEWLPLVQDVARTLNHRDGLRILPIAGEGSIQSVSDLSQIEGVDVALVPADSIAYAKAQGLIPGNRDTVNYLTRMGAIKVVLLARKEIASLDALKGKRIATGPAQSAGFATGEIVLGTLNIPFTRVAADGSGAIAMLEEGKADAALVLGMQTLANIKSPERFAVVDIPMPPAFSGTYVPSLITPQELKRQKIPGGAVNTIAAPLVLAVFNWGSRDAHSDDLYVFNRAMLEVASVPGTSVPWVKNNLAAEVPSLSRHSSATRALNDIPQPEFTATEQGASQ